MDTVAHRSSNKKQKMFWNGLFANNSSLPPDQEPKVSMDQLNARAASFTRLFQHHRQRMQQSLQSCQFLSEDVKQRQKAAKVCLFFAAMLGLMTVIAAGAIAVNQGGFVIKMMMMCAVGLPLVVFVTEFDEKQRRIRSINSSIEEFRSKVSLLNAELEQVKRLCDGLRRSLSGPDKVRVIKLEQSVLKVFLHTAELTEKLKWGASADCLTQVCEEYSRTFSELDKMKTQLSFYTGTWTEMD